MNTPKGERLNICFIGRINVGKSSLINRIVGQQVAIVSEQPGTTTDPVIKRFELPPLGPVTFFDTAGYDDHSPLGVEREKATLKTMQKSDLVLLLIDERGITDYDHFYLQKLNALNIPYLIVHSKSDLDKKINDQTQEYLDNRQLSIFWTSSVDNNLGPLLNQMISILAPKLKEKKNILHNLIQKNHHVVLVIRIDQSAPKDRIILPQMQVLRAILDCQAKATCCLDTELNETLHDFVHPPELVITDSQILNEVNGIVPLHIKLTTFSILFARYRGELDVFLEGLRKLKTLKPNDRLLIAEACSHQSQCDDIGKVKIPQWLKAYLGFHPDITNVSGDDFPDNLEEFKLVIHCGGCMLTRAGVLRRMKECQSRGVAITNYGLVISKINGTLERVLLGLNSGPY